MKMFDAEGNELSELAISTYSYIDLYACGFTLGML